MKTPKLIPLALLALFIVKPYLQAANVTAVNWGGDYVSGNQTFTALTGFSTTTPIHNNLGASGIVYGGARTLNSTYRYGQFPDNTGITDWGDVDEMSFCWPGNASSSAWGEVFWQKADFLNGASSAPFVQFDSQSSLSVSISGTPAVTRFVVQDAGVYYVSNLSFATSTTLNDPNNLTTWAPYIITSSSLPFDQTSPVFAQHTFSDIQAIGYYFDSQNNTNQIYHYAVTGFSAQVVPEPTSLALLVVSASFMPSVGYREIVRTKQR
jgi:hypothetical protein